MSNKITYRNTPENTHTGDSYDSDPVGVRHIEVDLPAMLKLLLERKRWIYATVGIAFVAVSINMFATPNRFTSNAVILPSGKSDKFSALRAMAGITSGMDLSDDNSSTLFPVILQSNLVLDAVLAREYTLPVDGRDSSFTLSEYIGKDKPELLRRSLSGMTSISSSTRTGEISLAVETEFPELSQGIVNEYLDQLEKFNLHSRRSEAGERVRYLSRELSVREQSLRAAEDSLESYQSRNRNWSATSSPMMLKELTRLKREAEARTKTYAYLLQEYEIAKLDAQKDVPVVRILDRASLPTVKSGPRRVFTIFALTSVAFILAVLGIIAADLLQQVGRQTDEATRSELAGLVAASFPREPTVVQPGSEAPGKTGDFGGQVGRAFVS